MALDLTEAMLATQQSWCNVCLCPVYCVYSLLRILWPPNASSL
jgi:hypothetical protein